MARRPRTLTKRDRPNRIAEWRTLRGLSQDALAERMQSSKQTVHRHENTSDVSLAAMIRYAAILDVRVEELLADSMRIPPTLSTLVKIADKLKPEQQALLTRLGNQIAQPDDLNNGDTPPASQAN